MLALVCAPSYYPFVIGPHGPVGFGALSAVRCQTTQQARPGDTSKKARSAGLFRVSIISISYRIVNLLGQIQGSGPFQWKCGSRRLRFRSGKVALCVGGGGAFRARKCCPYGPLWRERASIFEEPVADVVSSIPIVSACGEVRIRPIEAAVARSVPYFQASAHAARSVFSAHRRLWRRGEVVVISALVSPGSWVRAEGPLCTRGSVLVDRSLRALSCAVMTVWEGRVSASALHSARRM